MKSQKKDTGVKIFRIEEVDWVAPPEHFGALSKILISPDNSETKAFDFRISVFQPNGKASPHSHNVQETIWYILKGIGVVVLDGERHLVEPNVVIYIPPKVEHSIINTGLEDLVFAIAISPSTDV